MLYECLKVKSISVVEIEKISIDNILHTIILGFIMRQVHLVLLIGFFIGSELFSCNHDDFLGNRAMISHVDIRDRRPSLCVVDHIDSDGLASLGFFSPRIHSLAEDFVQPRDSVFHISSIPDNSGNRNRHEASAIKRRFSRAVNGEFKRDEFGDRKDGMEFLARVPVREQSYSKSFLMALKAGIGRSVFGLSKRGLLTLLSDSISFLFILPNFHLLTNFHNNKVASNELQQGLGLVSIKPSDKRRFLVAFDKASKGREMSGKDLAENYSKETGSKRNFDFWYAIRRSIVEPLCLEENQANYLLSCTSPLSHARLEECVQEHFENHDGSDNQEGVLANDHL